MKRKGGKRTVLGLILFLVISTAVFSTCGGNDESSDLSVNDNEATADSEEVIDAPELIMTDGFNELQSLFLQIDETYTEDEVVAMAKNQGFYTEDHMVYGNMDWVYISPSEKCGTKTGGESSTPIFNTDSIKITFTKDDDAEDKEYHAFEKDYRGPTEEDIHNNLVEYTFFDDTLILNSSETEEWKTLEESPWNSLKEALESVL